MRWPLQPLQPFQQTQLQPPFGQSVDSLCHPWFTTTNVSYRFPILKLPPPPCAVLLVLSNNYIILHQSKASFFPGKSEIPVQKGPFNPIRIPCSPWHHGAVDGSTIFPLNHCWCHCPTLLAAGCSWEIRGNPADFDDGNSEQPKISKDHLQKSHDMIPYSVDAS